MKYTDFVNEVAVKAGTRQSDTKKIMDAMCTTLKEIVKNGNEITLNGVGKFSMKVRSERKGINPATGEKITIPASKVPAFRASKEFKDYIN